MWVSFKIRVELQTEHRSFQLLLLLAANGWGCQVSGDCCCVLDFSMVGHSSSCGMGLWCLPVTNLLCQKCSGSTTTILLPCFYITSEQIKFEASRTVQLLNLVAHFLQDKPWNWLADVSFQEDWYRRCFPWKYKSASPVPEFYSLHFKFCLFLLPGASAYTNQKIFKAAFSRMKYLCEHRNF